MNEVSSELRASILRLILLEELFEYFEIKSLVEEYKKVHVYLVDVNTKTICDNSEKLISKGFYDSVTIPGLPITQKSFVSAYKAQKVG